MTTTPYAVSIGKGSQSFQGFVNAPITGPLSGVKFPFTMSYHNYGSLTGLKPTPPQFYPSQEPVNASMNTNARHQYIRSTSLSSFQKLEEEALGKISEPTKMVSYSTQRQYPASTHVNYIAPLQSSSHLDRLKSKAIGKSAYKVGLPLDAQISSKNYSASGTRSALQRARSSGCTAPKKKGAYY